jgi:transposase
MTQYETDMRPRITDALWLQICPLLPDHVNPHPRGGGRPRQSDRACLEAILLVFRTGCNWKSLGRLGLCAGSTAHDRYREWLAEGFFYRLHEAGLLTADCFADIDWTWLPKSCMPLSA